VSVLLRPAEVGEGVFAVEVHDEPRHLAVANVEQARASGPDLSYVESALLSTSLVAREDKDSIAPSSR
jgi:hypothetical protein